MGKKSRGDKYRSVIEGEERFFRYVHEVVDHVESATCFEVDSHDLTVNLKELNQHQALILRDDCLIQRL